MSITKGQTLKVQSVHNKAEAEEMKEEWQKQLPARESAYVPSGKMPRKALWLMLSGGVLGVPAGAAAAAAGLFIGSVIILLCVAIVNWLSESANMIWLLPFLVLFVVGLATFFGMYFLAGWAASKVVVLMGRSGKNRNPGAAASISALSALVAVVPFWLLARRTIASLAESEFQEVALWIFASEGMAVVLLLVGLAIAATAGAISAKKAVATAKFCEACEMYMNMTGLAGISYDSAKIVAQSLESGGMPAIVQLLGSAPETPREASMRLFSCPQCSGGILEETVSFSAQWPGKKQGQVESLSDSWLAASKRLSADEVRSLTSLQKT